MKFKCPLPEVLTAIPTFECGLRLDQILKIGFQMLQPAGESTFKTGSLITALASWSALLTATDKTKIVTTPIFAAMEIPSSEAVEEGGGDNSTPFGMGVYGGEASVTVTGQFRDLPTETKNALAEYSQYSQASLGAARLGVYLMNKERQIFHGVDGTLASGDPRPLPIFNFRVASRGSAGLNASDIIPFSFTLPGDWDRELKVTTPAFDPLTEL